MGLFSSEQTFDGAQKAAGVLNNRRFTEKIPRAYALRIAPWFT